MNAEIICVGTELLLGDVVNTNASDIAKGLANLGINVYYQAVVGDNPERLSFCLKDALSRSDMVILTGGLGPTYDDLTKETVAKYFNRKLVLHQESLDQIESYFKATGRVMTENNRKQAMMPEGCIVLFNPNGTAPGCIIEGENGKVAVMMPGPPREMRPMFEGPVKEYLDSKTDGVLVSRTINVFGIGESTIEHQLKEKMITSTNPTIAPYAKPAEVQLRVTAHAKNKEEGYRLIGPVVSKILEQYPDNVYGLDFKNIQEGAVKLLSARKVTLAVAESCTGGLICARLVEIPGSSEVFKGGVVAYSNELKQKLLGVKAETLSKFGAVSEECAFEMARGILEITGADIAVSTTGIAGPDGATDDKPVGLVYVAAITKNTQDIRKLKLARGRADDRENIRLAASSHALDMAIRMGRLV